MSLRRLYGLCAVLVLLAGVVLCRTYWVGQQTAYAASAGGQSVQTLTLPRARGTNATLPYAIQLADKGWRRACKENHELELGLNVVEGKVVYKQVADAWGLKYEPLAL